MKVDTAATPRNSSLWLWLGGALLLYAVISGAAALMILEGVAAQVYEAGGLSPVISGVISATIAFVGFWSVGILALVLYRRRQGWPRLAVLVWPAVPIFVHLALLIDANTLSPLVLFASIVGVRLCAGPPPRGLDFDAFDPRA